MLPNNKDQPPNNRHPNNDPNRPQPTPPQMPQDWRRWVLPGLALLLIIWLFLRLPQMYSGVGSPEARISYSELFKQAEAGNIERIEIVEATSRGTFREPARVTNIDNSQIVE